MEKKKLTQVGWPRWSGSTCPANSPRMCRRCSSPAKTTSICSAIRACCHTAPELIEISGGSILVRVVGSRLQLLAMTEEELRIGGAVDRVELVG